MEYPGRWAFIDTVLFGGGKEEGTVGVAVLGGLTD